MGRDRERVVKHTTTGHYEHDDCLDDGTPFAYDSKAFVHTLVESRYTCANGYSGAVSASMRENCP